MHEKYKYENFFQFFNFKFRDLKTFISTKIWHRFNELMTGSGCGLQYKVKIDTGSEKVLDIWECTPCRRVLSGSRFLGHFERENLHLITKIYRKRLVNTIKEPEDV